MFGFDDSAGNELIEAREQASETTWPGQAPISDRTDFFRVTVLFGYYSMTIFQQLNHGWNAEPNAPEPRVVVDGADVVVTFLMNSFQFPEFAPEDVGRLRFISCRRYRLGSTNDEGWYRGQCRFSKLAPRWGEFYELGGDLRLAECPDDWVGVGPDAEGSRHFLFYFRDEEFECDAVDWSFEVLRGEPGAAPNGDLATRLGNSGARRGRHR